MSQRPVAELYEKEYGSYTNIMLLFSKKIKGLWIKEKSMSMTKLHSNIILGSFLSVKCARPQTITFDRHYINRTPTLQTVRRRNEILQFVQGIIFGAARFQNHNSICSCDSHGHWGGGGGEGEGGRPLFVSRATLDELWPWSACHKKGTR